MRYVGRTHAVHVVQTILLLDTPVCEICENPIQIGEEYIENDLGEFFHYGCIDTVRQAIDWLGYEIKTLEDQFE